MTGEYDDEDDGGKKGLQVQVNEVKGCGLVIASAMDMVVLRHHARLAHLPLHICLHHLAQLQQSQCLPESQTTFHYCQVFMLFRCHILCHHH
jgi:hypothetical protein